MLIKNDEFLQITSSIKLLIQCKLILIRVLGGQTNGINDNKKYSYTYKIQNNYLIPEYWDVDCDCNLLNDLTGDYGFHEDRGTIKK